MKPGDKIYIILFIFFYFIPFVYAEEKITTTPLLNIEKIKPSFEELEEEESTSLKQNLIKI